jgi:hypothetical protein
VKDAAKATLNMIEIIDSREAISQNVENNWRQAELLIIG